MVGALGVVEVPLGLMNFGQQGNGLGLFQYVGYRSFAQNHRIPAFVSEVFRVEDFTRFRIVGFAVPCHKLVIHFCHYGIIRVLRLGGKTTDQVFNLISHLPSVLVHELAADKAFIAVGLEVIHTLLEAVGTHGQGMPELCLIVADGSCQLAPVHRTGLHGLAHKGGIVHRTKHGFNDRSVHRIFLDVFRRQGVAVVKAEPGVEFPGFRIDVVMTDKPVSQNIFFHFSVF